MAKEKAEEEKKDEGAPQQGEAACFITVFFEFPGSAKIAGLQTKGVSLNQVALAARELQNIVDFEQWWGFYASRMNEMEKEATKRAEEEMIRRALMQGGGKVGPN